MTDINALLSKIYYYYDCPTSTAKITINQDLFIGLFSAGDKPVFGSLRTIREKWKVLHCLGYLRPVNGSASTIDVPRLLKALGKGEE